MPISLIPAGLVYGDKVAFRHAVLLRTGPPIPWKDLAEAGQSHDTVAELTARIRAALEPLTLHAPDVRRLALAQELAWLLAEAQGSRVDLEVLRLRVRSLLPALAALSPEALADLEARVRVVQGWLREKGLRPDQVGYPYPGAEVRRWLPGATLRLGAAALLWPLALLFAPSYRLVGWAAAHFTDEGDQTATLKLLGGLLLHPLWAGALSLAAACLWGPKVAMVPPVALGLVGLGLPVLERAGEDLQAIRGFLRRRDPAVPELLEARRQLLEAFPELHRR